MTPRYAAPFLPGGAAPIDHAIADKLLAEALSQGGQYADLFFEFNASAAYGYEDGILKSATRTTVLGLGVRVVIGESTGYAYTEDLSEASMLRIAQTASRIARSGQKLAPVAFQPVSVPSRYPVQELSLDIAGEAKRDILERADRAGHAADPRIVRVTASLTESLRELLVITSTGKWASDRQPSLRFSVSVLAEGNGKKQSGSSGGGGRLGMEYFDTHSPEQHATEAVREATVMLDAREAPAGEMAVVLSPGDGGILLHEAVGHGLEADFNRKGSSHYTGRIGQTVASELCTVVDDATRDHDRGAINVDDEGNVPTSSVLIEKGRLSGYMHDRHSADFYGVTASGNGRRQSFRDHPMPRMTTTVLMGGQDAPEDIIRSVKRGIYARKFGGGQVDISNGDFVFSLTEGYLIEDGKITAPVKGVNLIGNGPDVMGKVVALGHDLEHSDGIWTCGKEGQRVPVGVGCPTVKISSVTVGGTEVGGVS